MDVGTLLRRTRERQGLSIEQLSQTTKIHHATIEALESNDVDRLPANVYTRGFIRAYAREVGLDPDDTVEQYLAQFQDAPDVVMADPAPQAAEGTSSGAAFNPRNIPTPVLAGAVVVLLVASYFTFASRVDGLPEEQVAAAGPPPAASDVAHAAASSPAATDATAAMAADALRIELTATGPSWVSASADRAAAANRLMQAGERQAIDARDELVLRVGDPGTLSVSINGVAAAPLGRAGQPITVTITKENFRSFLPS